MGLEPANVELHIDQLVLYDVDATQRQRVAAAIEQALTQLLAGQGESHAWSAETFTLDASTIQVSAGAKAEAIGAQVAQSVYGQIAGTESSASRVERSGGGLRSAAQ